MIKNNAQYIELEDSVTPASTLLKAMSNPNRLMILCILQDGEKCVGELQKILKISQPALSQHLKKLKNMGIVESRHSKQQVFYKIIDLGAIKIVKTLYDVFCRIK